MQYITDLTAVAVKPPVPSLVGDVTGYFTEGLPGQATRVRGWWLNMLQDEILNVIKAANIVPSANDETQLLQALLAIIGNHGLGFTPVQQGGGAGQGANKVFIGWSGTGLKAQVDVTDFGNIAFQSWVLALGYQTVTGHVATSDFATNANELLGQTYAYTGTAGTPTWVWGTNAGSWTVWNPAQFSVNYATSAGYAAQAGNATTLLGQPYNYVAAPAAQPTWVWGITSSDWELYNPSNFSVNYANTSNVANESLTVEPNWFASNFPFSGNYVKIAGGLMLVWGVLNAPADSTTNPFALPVAFPRAQFVTLISYVAGAVPGQGSIGATPINTAQFYAQNTANVPGATSGCFFLAIGY